MSRKVIEDVLIHRDEDEQKYYMLPDELPEQIEDFASHRFAVPSDDVIEVEDIDERMSLATVVVSDEMAIWMFEHKLDDLWRAKKIGKVTDLRA